MITLGGNIQLEGFNDLEYGEVLIAKKLVGNYIRVIAENCEECKLARILLEVKDEEYQVNVEVDVEEKRVLGSKRGDNLFFTMDKALKTVLKELNLKL